MAAYVRTLLALVLAALVFSTSVVLSQTESATVSGRITDSSGAVVAGTQVQIQSIERGTVWEATSNGAGIYSFPSVQPGQYHMTVRKVGFRQVEFVGLVLNVQDHVEKNFQLQIGSISESITVSGGAPLVNTEDATVSTVVNRNFAENLPMNGRSFQTLIQLTPGVVAAASNLGDGGQFNVNGQRANANYWMVDGVGANIGIASYVIPGNGLGGSLGSFSVLGGTNSLVSVDALQEFRIQTSSYAPEFGRTPGGQISIVTRSGTNQFHGTIFEYLRNDLFDANDWFADSADLPKARERQNDFGGTVGGPIRKDKSFFFFSYEGLRLRLPKTLLTTVPDTTARQAALPALQPFFNAFPLPNGPDDPTTSTAQFNASFSSPATLDAYSLRLDHRLRENLSLFGRYDYSPSELVERGGGGGQALSQLFASRITTQTATVGATALISSRGSADLRFNYSQVYSSGYWKLDNFGGAVPLTTLPFPGSYSTQNAEFSFTILSLTNNQYLVGRSARNGQRQFNTVGSLTFTKGTHSFRVGIDYRRLSPPYAPFLYAQIPLFSNVSTAESGNVDVLGIVGANVGATFLFQNLGTFAQDTWRATPRLTLTYGARWELDFAPSTTEGPRPAAVTGFNLNDLSKLALAPAGTSPFKTSYGNVAPRLGIAYELFQSQRWKSVVRGGFGTFYDLADGEIGNILGLTTYPYGAFKFLFGSTFPFDVASAAPPPITVAGLSDPTSGPLAAFDPHLRLPYTLQWNVAFEQALGTQQTISLSYVGSTGRRLIQTAAVSAPNPSFASAYLISNLAASDYEALQSQFRRQVTHGLQAIASYTWAHSIDTASAGSNSVGSNTFVPSAATSANRGSSDFDVRHAFSAGLTYDIPVRKLNSVANAVLRGWSLQNVFQAHSATPVNVFEASFTQLGPFSAQVRPDVVVGPPFYLFGSQYPGGKAINPAAFTPPPLTPAACIPGIDFPCSPTRQGDLGRNALRGFGLFQWDFAVHRDFPIYESLKLQFRAEMFNILNHPNFGPPQAGIGDGSFGLATQMLGQSLGSNVGSGGFDALYQIGGPRSIQLALKLQF
ncbi:MAG TPA: carboxypeptidase regulatory-like domain-containing protein [Candidatus Angelobacter sp.]